MDRIRLFHTGREEIRRPDIHRGRKNADFGQGFYLSTNEEFAERWAKEREGSQVYVNTYELLLSGLQVLQFSRDEAWFEYIYKNRAGHPDDSQQADVIIGPIANDTLYDTFGIMTSGFLSKEQSLQLMQIGPSYEQVVIRTEKAAEQLVWKSSRILEHSELIRFRGIVQKEEEEYQRLFSEELERITDS